MHICCDDYQSYSVYIDMNVYGASKITTHIFCDNHSYCRPAFSHSVTIAASLCIH